MPGEAWPWKKTWSPAPPSSLPRKKWLKPVSYNDAEDAYVERWPPRPSEAALARRTMTAAFQRRYARTRRSRVRSPAIAGCSAAGVGLTYGVDAGRAKPAP